jgi:diphthamide biosynthesis enzyme Dph1/Dph2-like protein
MYDLELARAVATIKDKKAKLVCIQLPEGLKPETQQIVKELEAKTSARVITCMPNVEALGVDLLIQWGHSAWSP